MIQFSSGQRMIQIRFKNKTENHVLNNNIDLHTCKDIFDLKSILVVLVFYFIF